MLEFRGGVPRRFDSNQIKLNLRKSYDQSLLNTLEKEKDNFFDYISKPERKTFRSYVLSYPELKKEHELFGSHVALLWLFPILVPVSLFLQFIQNPIAYIPALVLSACFCGLRIALRKALSKYKGKKYWRYAIFVNVIVFMIIACLAILLVWLIACSAMQQMFSPILFLITMLFIPAINRIMFRNRGGK